MRPSESSARHPQLGALERFGGSAVVDAPETHDRDVRLRMARRDDDQLATVPVVQWAVTAQVLDLGREGFHLHFAGQSLGTDDDAQQDVVGHWPRTLRFSRLGCRSGCRSGAFLRLLFRLRFLGIVVLLRFQHALFGQQAMDAIAGSGALLDPRLGGF
jgi:hypothetical protein